MNGLKNNQVLYDGDDELIRTFIKLTMNSKHKAYLLRNRVHCAVLLVSYMIIEIYCSDQRDILSATDALAKPCSVKNYFLINPTSYYCYWWRWFLFQSILYCYSKVIFSFIQWNILMGIFILMFLSSFLSLFLW